MAHLGISRDPPPVPAAFFQQRSDFGVEFVGHAPIIAKFCASRKQPIAQPASQSAAMAKTLNQILAANLRKQMADKQISANALGKLCGISPRTVGNYLRGDDPELQSSKSGKKRSAKLEEVEMLAVGLGIPAQALLLDPESLQRVAQRVASDLMAAIGGDAVEHAEVEPRKQRRVGA